MTDKSKKKILYVITKSVWGGAGKYVYDLAVNLPKEDFEVFVAAGGRNELAEKLIDAGIPYFEIKSFQRDVSIIKDILAYFEIFFLLRKIKPDIIHVNSSKAGGVVGVAAFDYRFLGFKFNLKTVFTAHGWAFNEMRPWWQILLIKLFTRVTCFFYSKIICVSDYDHLSAIKNHVAPERKLVTIHNGIAVENYKFLTKEEARKKLGNYIKLAADTMLVGTVGEYTKNKGQEYLIGAFRELKSYKLKAAIIGWGELENKLQDKIKNENLENRVFLLNDIPDAAPYLKAFDIFVLPSLKEGLPYTLLEAGLAGLPVVATNVGGIPEIIGHDEGLLVEPANADDLAEKIEELINDERKRKIFASALYHKVVDEFSLEKMLKATIAAYEKEN